jgi:hypothetical protein
MIQACLSFTTTVRAMASSVQEGMSGVAIRTPAKRIKTTALASALESQILTAQDYNVPHRAHLPLTLSTTTFTSTHPERG